MRMIQVRRRSFKRKSLHIDNIRSAIFENEVMLMSVEMSCGRAQRIPGYFSVIRAHADEGGLTRVTSS
jgi:hypothetical protein